MGYILGYTNDHLQRRGNTWYYYRRVPKEYADLDARTFVKQSLKTDSEVVAAQRGTIVNAAVEQYWQDLLTHKSADAQERFDATVRLARLMGLSYRPVAELSAAPLTELVEHARAAHKRDPSRISEAEADAILGGISRPRLTLSQALEKFWELSAHETRTKTPRELRRWQNPRKKAVLNFIARFEDKPLDEMSRHDALDFRAWWLERINDENLTAYAANKDIQHLSGIFCTVNDDLRLGLKNPFERLRLSEKNEGGNRVPFAQDYVKNTLLDRAKLDALGLSLDAQMLIYAATDTGCGMGELTGLDPALGEINLTAKVPHIHIKPNAHRGLKNTHRERLIPLTGAALFAFQKCPDGFPSYRGKADSASSWINKVMRQGDMFPSDGHSLYSLRHTFEDRMTAVDTPDKVAAALMGHGYHRPRYGQGPSLELKREWLLKFAFSKLIVFIFALLITSHPAAAAEAIFTGRACVIDGDSLVVGGERDAKGWCRGAIEARLAGADAPEWDQTCQDAAGASWACGAAAKAAMAAMADSLEVRCMASDRGYYGRPLATCATAAIDDVVGELVRQGLALATSTRYRAIETEAKAAKRGMWAGAFITPREWRKRK